MIFTGGYSITQTEWEGPQTIAVHFRVDDPSFADRYWQLYGNRRLLAYTEAPTERVLRAVLPPTLRATPLRLLAVEATERSVDRGDVFAVDAWNRYRVAWNANDIPDEVARFDVCLSDPDASADFTQVVGAVPRVLGKNDYTFDLPTLEQGTGTYQVLIVPRDGTGQGGNAGVATTVSINATVYPLDLAMQADGQRFGVAVSNGVLTASFAWGSAA